MQAQPETPTPETDPGVRLIDGAALARMLSASKRSVEKWTARRRLPGMVRMGRHWRYDVLAVQKAIACGRLLTPTK